MITVMRKLIVVILASFPILFVTGCDKEPERMDNYLVEFATVMKDNSTYRFRLDNGRLLIPKEVKNYSGEEGQRVYLNYVPLEGNSIRINYVTNIFTGVVRQDGFPDDYSDDPLKIQSVWVGGEYLNLIVETNYHSLPHSIALFHDPSSASVDLYLSHSYNDDPPGYPHKIYASFLLTDLRKLADTSPIPFRLFINTYTGIPELVLELK